MEHTESMKIILQKADNVAIDMLKFIDQQLSELGITEPAMLEALKLAIVTKMHEKVAIKK